MKILSSPLADNKAVYRNILQSKHIICFDKKKCPKYKKNPDDCRKNICCNCNKSPRNIMCNYETYVLQQYEEYLKIAPSFEKLMPNIKFGTDIEKELRKAYQNSKIFAETRKGIISNFKSSFYGRCPFCRLSEPETLDHYLCESRYPQFIVYAPNLVPCCNKCNRLKGDSLLNDNNERIFFHYYYDEIPEEPILECQIFLSGGKPSFRYYVKEDVLGEEADIYRRQSKKLGLTGRYDDACNGIFSTLLDELRDYYELDGIKGCETVLRFQLRAKSKKLGVNHYQTALLRGFLKDIGHLETMLKAL